MNVASSHRKGFLVSPLKEQTHHTLCCETNWKDVPNEKGIIFQTCLKLLFYGQDSPTPPPAVPS